MNATATLERTPAFASTPWKLVYFDAGNPATEYLSKAQLREVVKINPVMIKREKA